MYTLQEKIEAFRVAANNFDDGRKAGLEGTNKTPVGMSMMMRALAIQYAAHHAAGIFGK